MATKPYVHFVECPKKPGRKTSEWEVRTTASDILIGRIMWFSAWRCFCFYPEGSTIFDTLCLREVADRMDELNEAYKAWRPK